jgi:hypothetical protein
VSHFHHNIFYYYRGAKNQELDHERQLEDNTTKALVNTLQHSGKEVPMAFLNWLGIDQPDHIQFKLQKKTIGEGLIRRKKTRILLSLVPKKSRRTLLNKSDKKDARPDAWIYGDDFVVLIESKVAGYINASQNRHHFEKLRSDGDPLPEVQERTWAEAHSFFTRLSRNITGKSKWMAHQFSQYLEFCNMTAFTGFEKEIFDFFFIHDSEETKQWVRETVQNFADALLPFLKKIDPLFYEDYDVGNMGLKEMKGHDKKNHCWVAFGPKEKKYRQHAHQTFNINSRGIDIFVNVELKKTIDKLRQKIEGDRETFPNMLVELALKQPFHVDLKERRQAQASKYSYHQILTIESDYLKNAEFGPYAFDYIFKMLEKVELPYLAIRTQIDRVRILKMEDQNKDLIKEIQGIMKNFHPLTKYINEP